MKICLINNLYKPFNRGGAERIMELQVQELSKAGHDVFTISTKPYLTNTTSQILHCKSFFFSGLYYNLNAIPKVLRLVWHILDIFDFVNYFRIKSILKSEKPDIVITHNLKGISFLIPGAIKSLKMKHIHVLHDIQLLHPSGLMMIGEERKLGTFFAKIYSNVCRALFLSPDIIISPSDWLLKMHTNRSFFTNSKKFVLPNPVSSASYPQLHTENNNKSGNFDFLYAGQIEIHKGIIFLIESFNKFAIKNKTAKLLIAGEGKELAHAKAIADNNRIVFLGRVSQTDLRKIMSKCYSLIVPSLCYENSPSVIYEAATVNLPTIASQIGGIEELINNIGGIMFKANDKGSLISKLEQAIDNTKELKEIGTEAKLKIKKYSSENYIKKLETLL